MDLEDFDPAAADVRQCPYPWYELLRRSAPVHRDRTTGWWFVTRRDDIRAAFADPVALSSRVGQILRPKPDPRVADRIAEVRAEGWPEVPVLVNEDPPRHKRQRALVQQAFTARRVRSLTRIITETVAEVAAALPVDREFDFVSEFAVPVPVLLIAKALGIPQERRADFKRWSDNRVRMIGASIDLETQVEMARSEVERQQWFAEAFAERRAAPRDDLMTDFLQATLDEDGEPLTLEELLSIIGQVLAAGNESTTKLLTDAIHRLAERPDLWDWLRADPDARAPQVVEESLRLACPFQILLRLATADTLIGDVLIPKGDVVALVVGSGSRDESVFTDPEEFVPERPNAREHLAFGSGIHFCVGANLARTEAATAVAHLAHRFRGVRLGERNSFEFEPSFIIRGMRELHVVLSADDPAIVG